MARPETTDADATSERTHPERASPSTPGDGGAGGGEAFDDPRLDPPLETQTTDGRPTLELPETESWGRPETLQDHFDRHGSDFDCASEPEYAHRGSDFLQRSQAENLPTKIDPASGTIRVYDPETNTFGSYNADGTTKTFYRPDPEHHGYESNWEYWLDQPGKPPAIL